MCPCCGWHSRLGEDIPDVSWVYAGKDSGEVGKRKFDEVEFRDMGNGATCGEGIANCSSGTGHSCREGNVGGGRGMYGVSGRDYGWQQGAPLGGWGWGQGRRIHEAQGGPNEDTPHGADLDGRSVRRESVPPP